MNLSIKPLFKVRYFFTANDHIEVIKHFELNAQSIRRIAVNVLDGIDVDQVIAINTEKFTGINHVLHLIQGVIQIKFFTIICS